MRNQRILLAAASSLIVLAACSSDDTTTTDTSDTSDSVAVATNDVPATAGDAGASVGAASVGLKNSRFDPTEIEIAAGESVSFTNNDPFNHTVTSKDDSTIEYASGNLGEGETFVQSYGEAGSFAFFCEIHPTMRGTVIVS